MSTTPTIYQKTMTRPLPYVPGLSKRYPKHRVRRAVRAENVRKWLAVAPSHVTELAAVMGCSRFAVYHTLATMPDVSVTRGVVAMRGAA